MLVEKIVFCVSLATGSAVVSLLLGNLRFSLLLCVALGAAALINGSSAQAEDLPADSTFESKKFWILLVDRPDAGSGPETWTRPVASSYLDRLREYDVRPIVQSRWLHAVSARLTPSQKSRLEERSFVREVRPVASGRPLGPADAPRHAWSPAPFPAPPPDSLRYGPSRDPLSRINAVAPMNRGLDGRGVRIGFLDGDFRGLRHPAFSSLREEGRMIALRDFTDGRQSGNHGMGVASVAAGYASGSLVGPARGAEVLGATTEYTPSERNVEEDYFVAGLEWLHRRGADVVNVSIGYNTFDEGQDSYSTDDLDGDTGLTTRAVDRAAQLGITVVISAGNSGCDDPDSCWYYVNTPADADSAITVGAVSPDSSLASFSSRGPTADGRRKPDVVVQGEEVVAAWQNDAYARVGGTSFASPQVTGVVALMLQVNPDLSPMEVRRLLRRTASQADAPDNRRGWGIVNAEAAIRAAERRARATPPATLRLDDAYPNPASTRLTFPLHAPASTSTLRVTLQSPLGRTVAEETYFVRPGPNWLTVNVRDLSSGLYWYRVQGPQNVETGTVSLSP